MSDWCDNHVVLECIKLAAVVCIVYETELRQLYFCAFPPFAYPNFSLIPILAEFASLFYFFLLPSRKKIHSEIWTVAMETAFTHSLLMEGAAAAAISQWDSVARQQVTWRSLATTPLQKPDNSFNLSPSIPPHLNNFFVPQCLLFFSFSPKLLLMLLYFHGNLW